MYRALCIGELRNVYKILVGKPEGKRPFEMPRFVWKVNIKMLKKGKVSTGLI
jgi:hypothetical protein